MKLRKLLLHNFGVFRTRETIDLCVDPEAPIILFGGLNGAGKTTILDAIQLALYGSRAKCSKRGSLSYDDFLRRSISRGVPPSDGAAVHLEFEVQIEGNTQVLRVERSWVVSSSGARETLNVLRRRPPDRELKPDEVLAADWPDIIEELFPLGLSQLFFFDGDRIERIADLDNSQEVMHTALHSLLGLELVDRLHADLRILERRKAKETAGAERELQELNRLTANLEELNARHSELDAEIGAVAEAVADAEKQEEAINAKFQREGGSLLEQRKELELAAQHAEAQVGRVEEQLAGLAGGTLPLLLVEDMLHGIASEDTRDQSREAAELLRQTLEQRDSEVVEQMEAALSESGVEELRNLLANDREARLTSSNEPIVFDLPKPARRQLHELVDHGLETLRAEAEHLLSKHATAERAAISAARRAAAIPDEDAVASLVQERAEVKAALLKRKAELDRLGEERERLERERDEIDRSRQKMATALVRLDEAEESAKRIVRTANRTRDYLDEFRARVLARNTERVQHHILESFHQLMRKQGLVHDLVIEPDTLQIRLFARTGERIDPGELSAGERQLLAVSMLWGMAKASGRSLPTVIDTPLGRLDSVHRAHLVHRYFPNASHQVVLLSTDEEIDEAHLDTLSHAIGRSYHLEYDEDQERTRVTPGYFFGAVEAA